ncbi:hypothetical protein J6Z48_02855 [bacterium]|nr:hypothetical protein [bacterium]
MAQLSLLEKNAYISIIIKDNGIWTHLAYTDHNADREYILSDFTDLNNIRFTLDDDFFNNNFWYQYFDNLEKVFNWNIVDRSKEGLFTFRKFADEGDGITGMRIQIDDNQEYFDQIFKSVRDFSLDITLRVVDDKYMETLLKGLSQRLDYEDIMYIDMDLYDFSIYRVMDTYDKKKKVGQSFAKAEKSWPTEMSAIDSLKDSRFKAFLATDISTRELTNLWSNFILDKPLVVSDRNVEDVIRSYMTIQNFSVYTDNKQKIEKFGMTFNKTALIIGGTLPRILGKKRTLLSIIDGLELAGEFDAIFDLDSRFLTFGKTYSTGLESTDIILTKKDFLTGITKVIIPDLPKEDKNKVIMEGIIESVDITKKEFYVLTPNFSFIELPRHKEKLLIEANFKNGAKLSTSWDQKLNLISVPNSKVYDSILVDARPRPIIYGPDAYTNKIKLQRWLDDYKA